MVQLSHPYMTTGKTIALTIGTFLGKVISLLFNMPSRFFIAYLSRSNCLLISWLQSPSAVILEPKKIKSVTISTFPSSICPKVMGPDAMILIFWMFLSQLFYSLLSLLSNSSLPPLHFLTFEWYHLHMWGWCEWMNEWIQTVIHSAWHFTPMYSVYKLNNQSNSM